MARALTQGWVEQGGNTVTTDGRVSTTLVQRSYSQATVTVFNAGTAVLATIFSTEGGGALANPFVSDANGKWQFWADQGRYDIQFSGSGITAPYTYFAVEVVPSVAMLADPGGNGIVVRTALGVTTARTLVQPAAGITITNANGVAGNPTFALADDLLALEGLAGTGYAVRSAANTWVQRTITGTANNILITNGDGVAGNTVINIGANVVTNTGGAVTDNALVRMDGTTGRIIQESTVIVADTSGSFTVPNGWAVTNAGTLSMTLNQLTVAFSIPTGANAGPLFGVTSAAQTQSSGVPLIGRISTTYNQTATAGSTDLNIVRTETAIGSGQHDFIRLLGGAAGTTFLGRWDRLGNIYQGSNPAIIGDLNGNEQLRFVPTASAVNEWTFTNAATAGIPNLAITGNDANASGKIQAKGTGRIIIPGYAYTIEVNTNTVGNVGTGLDTLHSFTLPANSLAANGDFIEVSYGGTFAAASGSTKRVVVTFGGQNVSVPGLTDITGSHWSYDIMYIRLTSTTIRALGFTRWGDLSSTEAAPAVQGPAGCLYGTINTVITVADLAANTMVMLVQGETSAAVDNEVTQQSSVIKLTQRT